MTGWTVVVSIPMTVSLPLLGTSVRRADGATHQQDGGSVTFTPTDRHPAGVTRRASVMFTFDVDGVGKPAACAVDGRPCSGDRE